MFCVIPDTGLNKSNTALAQRQGTLSQRALIWVLLQANNFKNSFNFSHAIFIISSLSSKKIPYYTQCNVCWIASYSTGVYTVRGHFGIEIASKLCDISVRFSYQAVKQIPILITKM